MAMTKKCNRCGKLYAYYDGRMEISNYEKVNGVLSINSNLNNKYRPRKLYNICPDCIKKLEAFIKNDEDDIGCKE